MLTVVVLLGEGKLVFTSTPGSPGGRSGSPGDGKTCIEASCHSGTTIPVSNWISTNIPSAGYVPGQTYTITLTSSEPGRNKWGFEMSCENGAGQNKGSFVITSPSETQEALAVNITHKSGGTAGTDGRTWTANWVAPSAGNGTLTFYAAINGSNSNSSPSGDKIFTTSLEVIEFGTLGRRELSGVAKFSVFPNPTTGKITVDFGIAPPNNVAITLHSLTGQIVLAPVLRSASNSTSIELEISSDVRRGFYLLEVAYDGRRGMQPIVLH